jgi:hypothetical protein
MRHDGDDLGAHGHARLPGGQVEKGLAQALVLMMNLGTINERHGPPMSMGQGTDECLPLAQAVNLGGID